jgi:hypothetical protein
MIKQKKSKSSKAGHARKTRPVPETQVDADVAEVRALVEQEPAAEDECPSCHNGTLGLEEGRLVCRGECGAFFGDPPAAGSEPPPEPPPLAPPPVLPADLTAHDPAFVTGRRGQLCDVAFALLPDVVVWRTTVLHDGERTYLLAAWDDVCHEDGEYDPATFEPRSRAWYPVTEADDARLAAWDVEQAPEHVPGGAP